MKLSGYALDDYQEESRVTARYPIDHRSQEFELMYSSLAMCNESGEVAGEIKKLVRDEGGEVTRDKRDKIILELGDVLWYMGRLCDSIDVSMSDVAKANIKKLSGADGLPYPLDGV